MLQKYLAKKASLKFDDLEGSFAPTELSKKRLKVLLLGILVFSFLTRVLWLGNPKNEYFDEVYHAFTARLVLHSDPKAWEWWNPHPTGFAYEWTHPPVAKLLMAGSMALLGENSFAWRFPAAVAGTGIIFLVYLIAKNLFKDPLIGILSAGILALDGLILVMSRIGMNDIYFLFFTLLSLYLFLKEKNFYSAIFFGLALASKWSAVYSVPIFLYAAFALRKRIKLSYLWFIILPPLVYIGTYFQLFLTGHKWEIFWGMQKQMWWYHINLKATHAYTSLWWSWPLNLRPVYLYTSDEIGGSVARIYNIGNPVVFWFGLAVVIFLFVSVILKKFKFSEFDLPHINSLKIVLFSYVIFFVPWALSPRIMFFYHYLPSLPFLAIATGYVLRKLPPKFVIGLFGICLLVFIYFYPHWVGLRIPLGLDKSYYWFDSWR